MQKVIDAYNAGPGQADGNEVEQLLQGAQPDRKAEPVVRPTPVGNGTQIPVAEGPMVQ